MFMVSSACGNSLSHKYKRNLGLTVHKPAMKWFLAVRIARSAVLRRWIPWGVSWKATRSSVKICLSALEHSLSS